MFTLIQNFGPEIPFTILLLLLLALRRRVTPSASLWVNVPPETLWPLLDVHHGKVENWGRTAMRTELLDEASQTYRKTFTTTIGNAASREFTAVFRISERTPNQRIELVRADLDGKSERNELLKISYALTPENSGTRLRTIYHWGPRPLLAQLLARADLWGGAYRLKGQAENGKPNERPYLLISAGITIVTGLITLATFAALIASYSGWTLGIVIGLLLVAALFVHEFGHLLAYKLMGQPWGRMVFLPFLGALAMPRLPFESQGQSVFAALMGPGFSVILAYLCALPYLLGYPMKPVLAGLGLMTAGINIFNLLPAEPLDGGVALRSVLARVIGRFAQGGLMAIGIAIAVIGFYYMQAAFLIFGGTAILANIKPRKIDAGLRPLSLLQLCIVAFCYVTILAAHFTLLTLFLNHGLRLQS